MKVDIWIWTSTKAPKTAKGKYKYILAAKGGTRSGEGELTKTTGNRLVLMGVIKALERMTSTASITVHTDNRYLFGNAAYLPAWVAAGWRRKDNKKIQNEDLWRRIWDLQKGHTIAWKEDEVQSMFEDWREKM